MLRIGNYDFQKLVVARADCRVMVLEVKSDKNKEEVIQQLLQHARKCRHSTKGDRHLFACWNSVRRSFRLLSSYCHWVDHFPQAKKW